MQKKRNGNETQRDGAPSHLLQGSLAPVAGEEMHCDFAFVFNQVKWKMLRTTNIEFLTDRMFEGFEPETAFCSASTVVSFALRPPCMI